VVASECPGTLDLIDDTKNGFLFKNTDGNDLERKINLVLKNKSLQRKIKRNSKNFAKQFNWKTLSNNLEKLIFS
jgi:glycosyltransferase involved in cell wall biosynthesis